MAAVVKEKSTQAADRTQSGCRGVHLFFRRSVKAIPDSFLRSISRLILAYRAMQDTLFEHYCLGYARLTYAGNF